MEGVGEVLVRGVGGEDEGVAHACPLLPDRDKFVHGTVQRLPGERRRAQAHVVGDGVDPVLQRRRPDDAGPD